MADVGKTFRIVQQLLFRPKVAAGLGLAFFIFYMIGMETLFKNELSAIKKTDDSITSQNDTFQKQQSMIQKYSHLAEEIKTLPVSLAHLDPGDSAKVKAVSLAGHIQEVIQQPALLGVGSPLPAPHDHLELIEMTAGEPVEQNILEAKFPLKPDLEGNLSELKLWEFPYTFNVKGTSVALLKLINGLSMMSPLVVIKSIDVQLDENAETVLKYANTVPQASALPLPGKKETESSLPLVTGVQAAQATGLKTAIPPKSGAELAVAPSPAGTPNPLQSSPEAKGKTAVDPSVATNPAHAAPVTMLLNLSLFIDSASSATTPSAHP